MLRFSARIEKVGVNPLVAVPLRITREFGVRGFVPVRVWLGAEVFRATLVPDGAGRHRLFLNLPMRRAACRDVGDRIEIRVAREDAPKLWRLPRDLAAALRAAGRLEEFRANSPSRRKEVIRWVTAAKSADTRARRVKKAVTTFLHGPYRSAR